MADSPVPPVKDDKFMDRKTYHSDCLRDSNGDPAARDDQNAFASLVELVQHARNFPSEREKYRELLQAFKESFKLASPGFRSAVASSLHRTPSK